MEIVSDDGNFDSSLDLEDMAQHMLICMKIYEYWKLYVDRAPCNTSILLGSEYVHELLNGHPDRIYNLFRMEKNVFLRLYYTLESLDLLHEDRHVGV